MAKKKRNGIRAVRADDEVDPNGQECDEVDTAGQADSGDGEAGSQVLQLPTKKQKKTKKQHESTRGALEEATHDNSNVEDVTSSDMTVLGLVKESGVTCVRRNKPKKEKRRKRSAGRHRTE